MNNFIINKFQYNHVIKIEAGKSRDIAYKIPFSDKDFLNRFSKDSGLYVLLQPKENKAYVGQSVNLGIRILQPHKNQHRHKLDWDYAFIFLRSDMSFNIDSLYYLERRLYQNLRNEGFKMMNGSVPKGTNTLQEYQKHYLKYIDIPVMNQMINITTCLEGPSFHQTSLC